MAISRRIRTLFLPALATLAGLGILVALFFVSGLYDKTLWREPSFSLRIYLLFWLGLVPIGGLGAWLSRRAGGTVAERILAALAIVVGKLIGYFVLLPIALIISGPSSVQFVYGGLSFILVKFIAAPASALLLGSALFLHGSKLNDRERAAEGINPSCQPNCKDDSGTS